MVLNQDHIGRSVRSSEPFAVTRGDIRRFATAIGDNAAGSHDPAEAKALGHADLVAPPTFLITAGGSVQSGLVMDPSLGLDYRLVVHGEQSFILHRPVVAGDLLDCTTRIAGIRSAGRNELLTLVTDFTGANGPVASATSTLVSRGTAGERSGRSPAGEDEAGSDAEGGHRGPRGPRADEVQAGDELPALEAALWRGDLVRYAGASGDFNVIHWNERTAKAVGLPDVIAHGMLTMATAGRVITDWLGDAGAVASYGVRFSRPVPVPDDDVGTLVHVAGTVTRLLDDGHAEVALTATVDGGKVLSAAKAVVRLTS